MFLDALALTVYDAANSLDEDRWFTLGFDSTGQLRRNHDNAFQNPGRSPA